MISIRQEVDLYASMLAADDLVRHELSSSRACWLQVLSGSLVLNGLKLETGDGAAIDDPGQLEIAALSDSPALLFDMSVCVGVPH